MTAWRLYAAVIGPAAVVGALVALLISGGPKLGSATPRFDPLHSPSASPGAATSPRPARSPLASSAPSPSLTTLALEALLRPLASNWRPEATTVIVEQAEPGGGSTLIAIPSAGGSPLPLVQLASHQGWDLTLNGERLAVALATGGERSRVATWDTRTGQIAWLSAADDVTERGPVWSPDGVFVYFGRSSAGRDIGIFRAQVRDRQVTRVRPPLDGAEVSVPTGFTPDGVSLVWSKRSLADSVELFDLQTGAERSFGSRPARVVAWRPTRPRALVEAAGSGGTSVSLWDDLEPAASARPVGSPDARTRGADFDPAGTRVVVSAGDRLVLVEPAGTTSSVSAPGASSPIWLRAGIAYLASVDGAEPREVRMVSPTGTAPRALYATPAGLVRVAYISP